MNKSLIDAWAAGIFEGEGSFQILHGKVSKGIVLTSTDLDVLERLQTNYAGHIYTITKRKIHWKDSFIWSVNGIDAIHFYTCIKPFLLKRRSEKGVEWFDKRPIIKDNSEEIVKLFKEGKTHQQIADAVGLERSSVTKYINRNKINFFY